MASRFRGTVGIFRRMPCLRSLCVAGVFAFAAGRVSAAAAQPPAAAIAPVVTPADIRFMQEMLGHHAQALAMTALIGTHTRRADLQTLAERITNTQSDEMALMRRWLAVQGAPVPDAHAAPHDMSAMAGMSDAPSAAMMPGMLTTAQMSALRAAKGAAFDRLFLRGMIQHHTGALTMVASLLNTAGAAQESAINRFVIDVDADQRAEIARMRRMLSAR
jgi:uncharacterized protein (DUF305 family)